MENAQTVPFNTLSDTYHVWIPIEDNELVKSVSVDENGDYIVQGLITSDDLDEEEDSVTPEGMDCSYFLTKGWVKYEHGNSPNQFIGEPLETRVGRFQHPTTKQTVNGIHLKARLFASRELTRQAITTIQDLQKSNTKRRMGWSIEGGVKERCRTTGKVLKSVLRNVVLTMNPVNTTTWAELAKSFAKHHEVEVNMDKSMDTGSLAEVIPQSLEGSNRPKLIEPELDWVGLFRKFIKENMLSKSLKAQFLSSTAGRCGVNAYSFAMNNGLAFNEANEFASYIAERHEILKSFFGKVGGDTMSKAKSLASLLDTDLEELQKSLNEGDEEDNDDDGEDEEIEKSFGDDEEGDDDDSSDEEESDDDDSNDEEDDEPMEKSIGSSLRKSLSEDHGQAFEVSDFLTAIADELGFGMEGMQKSMTHMTKQQSVMLKSLTSMVQVVQDMALKVENLEAENTELRKSFGEMMERPVGRKSVVNQREVQTLQKSIGAETGKRLTRGQALEVLTKSFEAGKLSGSEVIRYEAGVPLNELNLSGEVKSQLGLV